MASLPFCLECSNYWGCIATLARNAHVLKGKRVKRLPLSYATRAGLLGSETHVCPFSAYAESRVCRGWEKRVTRIFCLGPAYLSLSSLSRHLDSLTPRDLLLPHMRTLRGNSFFLPLRLPMIMKKTIWVTRHGTGNDRVRFPRAAARHSETSLWKRQEKIFTEIRDNDGCAAG